MSIHLRIPFHFILSHCKFNKLTCLFLLVEFATVGQAEDGKIYHKLWSADEIDTLLKDNDLAKAEDSEEK